MSGLGGMVRPNRFQRVSTDLDGHTITLAVEGATTPDAASVRLSFDDAEHLAALLSDLARIVRHRAGVSRLVVA